MTYTLRENRNSKNFTPAALVPSVYGMERKIEAITWHHWGSLGQRFDDVENFLCTNNTPTSAHYIVEAGLVSCIVNPNDAAWHAGDARGNARTVGVEARPEARDSDYQSAAELVAYIRSWAGDIPLVPHNHWFNTACPGKWDLARLDRMARAVTAAKAVKPAATVTKPAPKPVTKPVPAKPAKAPAGLYWKVEAGDTLGGIAAHYGLTVAAVARYNGIVNVNGITVGQRIAIPGPLVWTVDPGDTLAEIAAHYGMDVSVLAAKNGIKNPNALRVGQVIRIL